jgi:hypothetical protein
MMLNDARMPAHGDRGLVALVKDVALNTAVTVAEEMDGCHILRAARG